MRSPRRRSLFLLVLLVSLSGFSGLWYATTSGSREVEPAFGDGYVEGMAGAPARVNPLFAGQNEADASLVSLIFAGLTRLDDRGRPFPDLAETWTVSQDARRFTFTLRRGLVWQDGTPLTPDDVVFTYSLLGAPGVRVDPDLARRLNDASIEKVDARNISIELSEPFAPLASYLAIGILPAHLLQEVPPDALFDHRFNQRPVGLGPYRLAALSEDRALLVASPTYHAGQPFIQEMELRFFADESLLVAALKGGEISSALFGSLSDGDVSYFEQHGGFQLRQLAAPETTYLYFNLNLPLFEDRRLRQALLLAIDRDALIRDVLDDQAQRLDSPLPPGTWPYRPTLGRHDFDPHVAGLLLDDAGWRRGVTGVRVKEDRELSIRLSTNNDPVRRAVAEEIARRWTTIGLRVAVDAVGATTLVREVLEPRSYEAVLFGAVWGASPDPYPFWHSSRATGKGWNLAVLRDTRFDSLLEEARSVPSQARRLQLYEEFQVLFAQEVPAIPLYADQRAYVQASSLLGDRPGYAIDAGARFWQVQEWHLKTR